MTFARLAYHPQTVIELRNLLKYMKKQELKQQFCGNTLCFLLKAMKPQIQRPFYSEYVEVLDGQAVKDTRTGVEIVEDLKNQLIKRKNRRQKG